MLFADAIEHGSDLYSLKTEDGFKVKKLYIKIIDSSISSDEVELLLSIYGPIEEFKIGLGKCRMKNRGVVTYAMACDATRALVNRKNFKEYFSLNAADSWLQPDYHSNLKAQSFDNSIDNSSSLLLSSLDDDCLIHVMSFLDPLDILTLKKVCAKFFELSDFYFRTIKSLNFMEMKGKKKMTLLEVKLICEKVGKNVKKLTVNSDKFNNQRILNFIPKYFPNLKHLNLIGFKLDSVSFWQQMKRILVELETLDLSDNSLIDESFLNCFSRNLNGAR